MTSAVTLETVAPQDMPAFRQRLQHAFTQAANEEFPDFPEVIPPERDMDESFAAPGAEALQIVCEGEFVGGAITSGEGGQAARRHIRGPRTPRQAPGIRRLAGD